MKYSKEAVCILAAGLFALAGCSKSSAPNASSSAPASPAPAAAAKASGTIDVTSLLTQQDAEEIVGKGATLIRGSSADECTITAADKIENFMVSVNNMAANVAAAKQGALTALKNAQPVPGIGDEAYADSHTLVVLKGQSLILFTGVSTKMPRVPEVEKKLAMKIIAKL
jgi:hypothetical protein